MGVRVNYTQRGFRDKDEYELYGGRTDTEDYDSNKLQYASVRCKNPSCMFLDKSHTISSIESRDLESDPIICAKSGCNSKNINIKYFKPNVLPLIFVDENHANTNMYNDILQKWNEGKIHRNFEPIIQKLKHPDFYYGSEGRAIYVDQDDPMMGDNIQRPKPEGGTRTWREYPWVDVNLVVNPPVDYPDPILAVVPLSPLPQIPSQQWLDENYIEDFNTSTGEWYDTGEFSRRSFTNHYESIGIITHEVIPPDDGIGEDRHKVYIKKGAIWNWYTFYTSEQKELILEWEIQNNTEHPLKDRQIPGNDQPLWDITQSQWQANNDDKIVLSSGQYFIGHPGAPDLKIYAKDANCDCINNSIENKLPGIDEDLLTGFDLPPIPLYVDPSTGAGSEETEYTKKEINNIKEKFPWITTTTLKTREGTEYSRIIIPPEDHMLINIINQRVGCPPCINSNNMMYSSVFYIITQVDLEDPIY